MVDYVQAFIELGFPVGVAVFLLVNQAKQIDRMRMALLEVRIGVNLILQKLDAIKEFEEAIKTLRKEDEHDGV